MTEIMNGLNMFCTEKDVQIATSDVISKIINKLFRVQSSRIYEQGEYIIAFQGLKQRVQHTGNENLTFPNNCQLKTFSNHELNFLVPFDLCINGQQQYCEIHMEASYATLTIQGHTSKLKFCLTPVQHHIDGILHLVKNLHMCEGQPIEKSSSESITLSTASGVLQKHVVKSKSCTILLPPLATSNACSACKDYRRKTEKRKALKEISNKLPRLNSEMVSDSKEDTCVLDAHIQFCEEDHKDFEILLNNALMDAPEKFQLLLHSQLQNCRSGLDTHQRRWDPRVINICLQLFLRSPQAYEDLQKSGVLVLPSKRLLQYYKNSCSSNEDNLAWMKIEAERQGIPEFGRHGGLLIDEMSIQDDLVITKVGDCWKLIGMVDMGTTNENIDIICKGKKVTRLASQALQFVFHGFTGFRWPVSYYGSTTATSHQLYLTFWKSVDALEEMGFTVDYMMADGATTNRTFTSMLFNGDPREELFLFKNVYNREHVMVAIQDIKHVLKRIRNNIESSRKENKNSKGRYLVIEGQAILWDHWEECFLFNYQGGFEIHNKLTEDHITLIAASKMRNQLAIDVLNKNMLFLMKSYQQTLPDPERLSSSIRLLEATSIICDIFCSINHPVTSMEDPRIAEISQALQFFNRWEADILESSPTLAKKNLMTKETRDDINSSLVGFTSLCRQTTGKGNSLNPGFLNSDLIENFFCQQRGIRNGLNSNPTLEQFAKSSTAIVLGQCLVSRRANASESASSSYFRAKLSRPLNSRRKSRKQMKVKI